MYNMEIQSTLRFWVAVEFQAMTTSLSHEEIDQKKSLFLENDIALEYERSCRAISGKKNLDNDRMW